MVRIGSAGTEKKVDIPCAGAVSFGGLAAKSFKVLSDSEILATPPPYSAQRCWAGICLRWLWLPLCPAESPR